MAQIIAEKTIEGALPDGTPIQFSFTIAAPEQIDSESWGCVVTMEGFSSKPHRVVGQDSWQALTLAVRSFEQQLAYYLEDGGKLFWSGTKTPMTLQDIIPRFSRAGT